MIHCQCSLHFHSPLFKVSFSLPCYMSSQSYSPLFYYFNTWRCNLWRSLLCNCYHSFAPVGGSNIFLVALFVDTINLRSRSRILIRSFYTTIRYAQSSVLHPSIIITIYRSVQRKKHFKIACRNFIKMVYFKVPLECGAASSGEEFPTFRRNVFLHSQLSIGKLDHWQRRYCLSSKI